MVERDASERARIVRPIDWTAPRALAVALGVTTSAIHFYAGVTTGEAHFYVLGLGLLSGVVVFLTRLWKPVLYLVGALYVTMLLSLWVLAGMPQFVLGSVDAAVQIALVVTFFYLFLTNSRASTD